MIGTKEEAEKVCQTAIGKHNQEKYRIDTALRNMRGPSLSGDKEIEELHLSICVEERYVEAPHKIARVSKPKAA